MGADAYLTKPFHPRELVAWVKAVLRRSTAQDRAAREDGVDSAISVGEELVFSIKWGIVNAGTEH